MRLIVNQAAVVLFGAVFTLTPSIGVKANEPLRRRLRQKTNKAEAESRTKPSFIVDDQSQLIDIWENAAGSNRNLLLKEEIGMRFLQKNDSMSSSMSMPTTSQPTARKEPTASPSSTNAPSSAPSVRAPSSSPTAEDCLTEQTRAEFLSSILTPITPSSLLLDVSTAQGKAFEWLSVIDTLMLDPCDYPTIVQRYALVVLYYSTNGRNWDDSTDWLTTKVECEWYGLTCDMDTTEYVEDINLSINNLSGTLPEEIKVFETLRALIIFGNSVSGSLPNGIGSLTQLRVLDFEENQLTGSIFTDEILGWPNIESLRFSFNGFTDSIPTQIASLTTLRELWLAENAEFNQDGYKLFETGIIGTIPTELGLMEELQSLFFYDNNIEGTIPSELGRVTLMEHIRFEDNLLTESIPEELYAMTELKTLQMNNNILTGFISTSLGNLAALTDLRLNINYLSGTIPSSIDKLTDLENFLLHSNYLTGPIPNAFTNYGALDFFDVSTNDLTGSIPDTIFGIPSLRFIYLSNNTMTGTLPSDYATPPMLRDLFLDGNQFSGTVPGRQDGQLLFLTELLLNRNNLTGVVPDSICALRSNSTTSTEGGQLEDLWSDCAGLEVEIICPFPDCCNRCFEQ